MWWAFAGCATTTDSGPGGPTTWECGCNADYQTTAYYYTDWPVYTYELCDYPEGVDQQVDQEGAACAVGLVASGAYDVTCACTCDDTRAAC